MFDNVDVAALRSALTEIQSKIDSIKTAPEGLKTHIESSTDNWYGMSRDNALNAVSRIYDKEVELLELIAHDLNICDMIEKYKSCEDYIKKANESMKNLEGKLFKTVTTQRQVKNATEVITITETQKVKDPEIEFQLSALSQQKTCTEASLESLKKQIQAAI